MLLYLADLPKSHSWQPCAGCVGIPETWGHPLPAEFTVMFSFPLHRCMYVGDTDAWCEAFSRSEEQWCDRSNWEWGKITNASKLPSYPLQPYDEMLGLWPQQAAPVHWAQSSAQVGVEGERARGWGRPALLLPPCRNSASRSFISASKANLLLGQHKDV